MPDTNVNRATLGELEDRAAFERRHVGPDAKDQAQMLAALGFASREALMQAIVPPAIRRKAPMALPAGKPEAEALAAAAGDRGEEQGLPLVDRAGLLRHPHARGDPAQHPREPRLVHGLHAVPARDLAGPPGGAGEFPDDGLRPHRDADRQRLHARRGHGGGRGHDAVPALRQPPLERLRRRLRRAAADARRAAHARRAPGARDPRGRSRRARRHRRVRGPGPVPGRGRRGPRLPRPGRGAAREGGAPRRGGRPPRACAPRAAGRVGRGRGRGLGPALRRAHGLRRPARGLPRHEGRAQAQHARAPGRRDGRRPRQSGLPPGAADARAAHPPREGDLQHLHRAGPPRGDRLHVRGLPRPGRARAHRAPRAPPDRDRARGPREAGIRGPRRGLLRHARREDGSEDRRHRGEEPARGREPAARRRAGAGPFLRRDHHRRGRRAPLGDLRRAACRLRAGRARRGRARASRRRSPARAPTSRTRSSTATTRRPRCCATSGGSPTRTSRSTAR